MISVSVIIPIFKVESLIERCAISLFQQTMTDIEFVFVDDASPDNSISILEAVLEAYPERKQQVRIIRHEQNKGLPAARNSGLKVAEGAYIFHCDSDDCLVTDAIEQLYKAAVATEADIVWCDWYLASKSKKRYMSQAPYGTKDLTPEKAIKMLLDGTLKYNVWNKLTRRKLYAEYAVLFPEGKGMGEDMTMIKLFAFAKKVSYLPKALYHYTLDNRNAFTRSSVATYLDEIEYNTQDIIEFLENRYGNGFKAEIQYFKLNVKLPLLISDQADSYRLWLKWFPESNIYIDQNPAFSFRSRLVQKAAYFQQFWFLKLYYYVIICGLSKLSFR